MSLFSSMLSSSPRVFKGVDLAALSDAEVDNAFAAYFDASDLTTAKGFADEIAVRMNNSGGTLFGSWNWLVDSVASTLGVQFFPKWNARAAEYIRRQGAAKAGNVAAEKGIATQAMDAVAAPAKFVSILVVGVVFFIVWKDLRK